MSALDVKDEIDAQSGRFEFLKQSLTLGLAGLAGTAAIFTDSTKIPSDPATIITACVIGAALLTVVGFALMGLSVYANLLKADAASTAIATDTNVAAFRKSIVRHAQWVFGAIAATAIAFVVYAGLQVAHRDDHRITSIEAINISRKAMAATGCASQFDAIVPSGPIFRVGLHSDTCRRGFIVTVQALDGSVSIKSTR